MELFLINEMCSAKTEKEDCEMKEVSKLMSELEDKASCFISNRDTNKYNNIKPRLSEVTTVYLS